MKTDPQFVLDIQNYEEEIAAELYRIISRAEKRKKRQQGAGLRSYNRLRRLKEKLTLCKMN
jgi:hypothetical protein